MIKETKRIGIELEKYNSIVEDLKRKTIDAKTAYERLGMQFEALIQGLGLVERIKTERQKDLIKLGTKYDIEENVIFDYDFDKNEIVVFEDINQ